MGFNKALRRTVATQPIFRPALSAWFGTKYSRQHFFKKVFWPYWSILRTGEFHNFTFAITETSTRYLAEMIAVVMNRTPVEIEGYFRELLEDRELADHLRRHLRLPSDAPPAAFFGRRLGWYAFARALKPKVIVETGVERGHGSVLLCSALLRNAAEGSPGRYYGTDINSHAGEIFTGRYTETGKILYGDSIESLKKLQGPIDLFVNDSDHSADYEAREYATIADKLSTKAVILGDNSHVTDKLARFARETGRRFIFFREVPKDHWYPGSGIGIAYPHVPLE